MSKSVHEKAVDRYGWNVQVQQETKANTASDARKQAADTALADLLSVAIGVPGLFRRLR